MAKSASAVHGGRYVSGLLLIVLQSEALVIDEVNDRYNEAEPGLSIPKTR